MDFEKKYRDLVEAVKELQEANPSDEGIQKWVNDNVPELKENEDKRIKRKIKEVIDTCLNIRPQIIEEVDYLQIKKWLEK